MPNNINVANKISKIGDFIEIASVGYPTKSFPVNIKATSTDGTIIYVAYIKYGGWQVEYSYDPNMQIRAEMKTRRGFRNQTETLDFVKKVYKHAV